MNIILTTLVISVGIILSLRFDTNESYILSFAILVICPFFLVPLTKRCNFYELWASILLSAIAVLSYSISLDFGKCLMFNLCALMMLIPLCIAAIYKTGKTAVDGAEAAVKWVVYQFVDLFTLKNEVKRKCPKALKMEIMKRKENAVDVGIFNDQTTTSPSQFITIESTEGFSDEIREGQTYTLVE